MISTMKEILQGISMFYSTFATLYSNTIVIEIDFLMILQGTNNHLGSG